MDLGVCLTVIFLFIVSVLVSRVKLFLFWKKSLVLLLIVSFTATSVRFILDFR